MSSALQILNENNKVSEWATRITESIQAPDMVAESGKPNVMSTSPHDIKSISKI